MSVAEFYAQEETLDRVKTIVLDLLESSSQFRAAFRAAVAGKSGDSLSRSASTRSEVGGDNIDNELNASDSSNGLRFGLLKARRSSLAPSTPAPSPTKLAESGSNSGRRRRKGGAGSELKKGEPLPPPLPDSSEGSGSSTDIDGGKPRAVKPSKVGVAGYVAPPLPDSGEIPIVRRMVTTLDVTADEAASSGSSLSNEWSEPNPVELERPPLPDDDNLPVSFVPGSDSPRVPPSLPPPATLHSANGVMLAGAAKCERCSKEIAIDEKYYEVGIDTEEHAFYHVACFTCIDCDGKLAEEDFKLRDGQIYCDNCFAQRFCPRCGGCNEPITTHVFSVALGKSWHKGHFACVACNKGLTTDFVSDAESRPFCNAECFSRFVESQEQQE